MGGTARSIINGRIFTKRVLNVLRGLRFDQPITGWEKGQVDLGKLVFEVQQYSGRRVNNRPSIKFNFPTPEKEQEGINDFLLWINECPPRARHSLVVNPKGRRRLFERRPIHRLY